MNITVYCSARDAISEQWKTEGKAFGGWIARQGHQLVYGGATGGLMSAVAEGVHEAGGTLIGVIPQRIMKCHRLSPLLTQKEEVGTMSERKQRMRDLADVFVVLPGGYGTLDELFDAVASGTVGEHHKPLFLLNLDGIYDGLLQVIERMHESKLIPEEESYTFQVVNSLAELEERIVSQRSPLPTSP